MRVASSTPPGTMTGDTPRCSRRIMFPLSADDAFTHVYTCYRVYPTEKTGGEAMGRGEGQGNKKKGEGEG